MELLFLNLLYIIILYYLLKICQDVDVSGTKFVP